MTLGIAEPHPLAPNVLESAAECLHRCGAALSGAGYEVQTERFSTRPMLADLYGWRPSDLLRYAVELQEALEDLGVGLCSLGPAMPGMEPLRAEQFGDLVVGRPALYASVLLATEGGDIDFALTGAASRIVTRLAEAGEKGLCNFRFAALACAGPSTPFFPAAYHSVDEPRPTLTVGLQAAAVIEACLLGGSAVADVPRRVTGGMFRAAGPVADVAARQAAELGIAFGGLDLSPAPGLGAGQSIVGALEQSGDLVFGGPGTLAMCAAVTAGIKAVPLRSCGYCGLMLPVMEDELLARRWEGGLVDLDRLLAYSAVCGTGLDTVPLPGTTSADRIKKILCDVASLAVRLRKPLSARLMPAPGRDAGDRTDFASPYLVTTTVGRAPGVPAR